MNSSVVPAGFLDSVDIQPSGGVRTVLESLDPEGHSAESLHSIPHHPLSIKPSGNQYTARVNSQGSVGPFQLFPDEILVIFLEYLDSCTLRLLGSTCKFLHAFCKSEEVWKPLFIE